MASEAREVGRRLHDLDALRSVAMLFGVVLHASLFLIPQAWPVQDPWAATVSPEANAYIYALSAIHGFRMPVFFLLSGFFAALLWQRRGLRALAAHRLRRVGIPLVAGALVIVPINAWLLAGSDFNPWFWPVYWWDSLHQLWFLWILLLVAAGFILAVRLGLGFKHPLWWLAVPAVVLPQLLMYEPVFGPDTSDGLVPSPVVLAYYALFFAFGAFMYRGNMAVRRWWAAGLAPAALILLPGMFYVYESSAGPGRIAAALLQVAYAWLTCFGMMGLFRLVAYKERDWVRYLSDASYWIYLWHLPLIVAGQRILVDWAVNPHLKFAILCLVVPLILLVLYRFCVRYTRVGTVLNGRRVRGITGQQPNVAVT